MLRNITSPKSQKLDKNMRKKRAEIEFCSAPTVIRPRWKEFLKCLDDHFLQVHRSYVVKKESVKLIGKNYLELYSGERVPVSAKNVHEIVQALTKSK